jgi:predicted ribosome quality control (RQC) complex YloA/Tae2 family protein
VRPSLRRNIILAVAGVLFLGLVFGGGMWFKGSGEKQIRALLEKTEERYKTDIEAADEKIKDNEAKADAYREAANQARARADVLARQAQAIRPVQTDAELKERYEKLGYHPTFR